MNLANLLYIKQMDFVGFGLICGFALSKELLVCCPVYMKGKEYTICLLAVPCSNESTHYHPNISQDFNPYIWAKAKD